MTTARATSSDNADNCNPGLPEPSNAPLAHSPRWWVMGASVRGASHIRADRPNQDAIGWRKIGHTVIIALADGHGSARYLRSHQGAKLAVQTTLDELEKFYLAQQTTAGLKRHAEEQLPRTLVRSWQDAVARKLVDAPLTPAEMHALGRHLPDSTPAEFLDGRPHRVFGATLLAAIIGPDYGLYLQLGDGDIVTVNTTGNSTRLPLVHDERLIANQTTSLAGTRAWQDMRVYFQPFVESPPTLILLATDGYANSFQDDDGFLTAAADYQSAFNSHSPAYIRRHLPGWLTETSAQGSGDDITVGLVVQQSPPTSRPE